MRGQGRVWGRSLVKREGSEGKSAAEEQVEGAGALQRGGGAPR